MAFEFDPDELTEEMAKGQVSGMKKGVRDASKSVYTDVFREQAERMMREREQGSLANDIDVAERAANVAFKMNVAKMMAGGGQEQEQVARRGQNAQDVLLQLLQAGVDLASLPQEVLLAILGNGDSMLPLIMARLLNNGGGRGQQGQQQESVADLLRIQMLERMMSSKMGQEAPAQPAAGGDQEGVMGLVGLMMQMMEQSRQESQRLQQENMQTQFQLFQMLNQPPPPLTAQVEQAKEILETLGLKGDEPRSHQLASAEERKLYLEEQRLKAELERERRQIEHEERMEQIRQEREDRRDELAKREEAQKMAFMQTLAQGLAPVLGQAFQARPQPPQLPAGGAEGAPAAADPPAAEGGQERASRSVQDRTSFLLNRMTQQRRAQQDE